MFFKLLHKFIFTIIGYLKSAIQGSAFVIQLLKHSPPWVRDIPKQTILRVLLAETRSTAYVDLEAKALLSFLVGVSS